jgi:phosphate-selective porin OprO/OprP
VNPSCQAARHWLIIGLLLAGCVAAGAATNVAQAQPPAAPVPPVPPVPPTQSGDVQELLERLRAAEWRIEILESGRRLEPPPFAPAPPVSPAVPAPSEEAPAPNEEAPAPEEEKEEKEEDSKLGDLEDELDEIKGRLDEFVIPGTDNSTMQIYGRVQVDAWGYPGDSPLVNLIGTGDPNTTEQNHFGFRRLRPGIKGKVNDLMEYRIELELSNPSNFQFRNVWLGFDDMFGVRQLLIGNQKRPYGLDALHSSNQIIFLERPFIVDAFNDDYRRLGIVAYDWTDDLRYNWRYGVYNLRNIQDEGTYFSDHMQGEIAGRFATTYWWDEWSDGRGYGHFGIAGNWAEPDGLAGNGPDEPGRGRAANEARFRSRGEDRSVARVLDTGRIAGTQWYSILGIEHVLNVGPLQVGGEYMINNLNRASGFAAPGRGNRLFFHGGYAYAAYFLTGEHMPWDRENGIFDRVHPFENFFLVNRLCGRSCDREDGWADGWGAWQVAARYSYADLTDQNIFGGVGSATTLALVWYWNANANVQMDYTWGHVSDRMVEDEDTGAIYTAGGYEAFGVRARIDF